MQVAQKNQGSSPPIRFRSATQEAASGIFRISRLPPPDVEVVPPGWGAPRGEGTRTEALLAVLTPAAALRAGLSLWGSEIAWRVQLFRERFELTSLRALRAALGRSGVSFADLRGYLGGLALTERLEQALADVVEADPGLQGAHEGRRQRGREALARILALQEQALGGHPLGQADCAQAVTRLRARLGPAAAVVPPAVLGRWARGLAAVAELERAHAAAIEGALALDRAVRLAAER